MNEVSDSPAGSSSKPVRILVAEDSPLNQQVALKQLEKLGYQADAVSDGTQVLEALARTSYDIILMDCQMPEMSGYEAAWQIRNREKEQPENSGGRGRVQIIAMTANTKADDREKCLAAGMDDFINKPVQLPELEAAVLRGLANRAAARTTEETLDPVIIASLRQLRTPGKPDPISDLIDLFLREAPSRLDAMEQAVLKIDATSMAALINAATNLKGSSANLGARNLAALCDEIEQVVRSSDLADVQPLIERARQELQRVQGALSQLKSGAGISA
jgi:two-component system, sensor histidine kinase and response regulator